MSDSLSQAVETALGAGIAVPASDDNVAYSGNDEQKNPSPTDAAALPRRKKVDHHLWGTYILLVSIAIVELFSASVQEVHGGNIFEPILRQGIFLVIGLAMMLIIQKIHYRHVYNFIPIYVIASICLLVAVAAGGEEVNGAVRRVRIAGIPVLPAEFMKLAAALGMAWILTQTQVKDKHDVTWGGFVACLLFMLVSCVLLFSQGLSNTLIVVAISFSMMLVGGMSLRKVFLALAIVGALGGTAIFIKTQAKDTTELTPVQRQIFELNHVTIEEGLADGRGETWKQRLIRHFKPDKYNEKFDVKHQQEQLSYIAQAHSGIIGVGPGKSRENARLPLASLDYIYAIIIEELGLLAGLGILIIYMWILGRSAKLTMQFKMTMPGVLVMGCAFTIVFQALFHMSIVTGVFPVSGQPLPLISKGGISVLATSLAFGVMLSCAKHAARASDTKAEQAKERASLPENARSVNPVLISDVDTTKEEK